MLTGREADLGPTKPAPGACVSSCPIPLSWAACWSEAKAPGPGPGCTGQTTAKWQWMPWLRGLEMSPPTLDSVLDRCGSLLGPFVRHTPPQPASSRGSSSAVIPQVQSSPSTMALACCSVRSGSPRPSLRSLGCGRDAFLNSAWAVSPLSPALETREGGRVSGGWENK